MTNVEPIILGGRELPSWIDGFIQLTESIQSPILFRKWAAISAIGAALERKVWIRSQGENLYPNLYVLLVGPPGSGKTRALDACERLFRDIGTHNIAKVNLTKAALMDELSAASRVVHTLPPPQDYNTLFIAAKELGALLPNYDSDFLNVLVTLYDCHKYDEKRRGSKEPLVIERPQINLIGCTTPGYLVGTMPIGAWEQGFLARVIIIYSDQTDIVPLDLLEERKDYDTALAKALTRDMKKISDRIGRLKFTEGAAHLLETWNRSGREPPIEHPRLIHYATRRIMHLLKLCMIACIDRGAENIDVPDYNAALDWLVEAESLMPNVFTAMSSGGDAAVINEAWHYVISWTTKHGEGMPVPFLYEFLQSRLPAMSVQKVYEVMLNSRLIKLVGSKDGMLLFAKPR